MTWISVADDLPETGQFVLAYFKNEYGKDRRIRAFYAPKHTIQASCEDDFTEYNTEKDEYFLPEGWYETNEFEENHWFVDAKVTHWQQLPEPPEEAE